MSFNTSQVNSIEALAKSLALKGLPKAENDILSAYTSSYTAGYKGVLVQQLKSFGGDHDRLAQAERDNLIERRTRIEKKLEKALETKRTMDINREEIPADYRVRNNFPNYAAIGVIAFGEAILSKSALSIFDNANNLYQVFILACLTLIYVLLPASIIKVYRATEEAEHKHIIRIGFGAIIIAGFFVIAILRTTFLQNIGTTTLDDVKASSTLPIKPIYWIGLNMLFLVVSVYCASLIETRDEKKINIKAKDLDKKLKGLDEEIREYERQLDDIPNKLYEIERRLDRQKTEEESVKQRITSLHVSCINSFITTNNLYRTDGAHPTCYDDPIPSLY